MSRHSYIMCLYRGLYLLMLLLPAQVMLAQSKATVKASADRTTILIGEPIRLTIEADIPGAAGISFFTIDSIAHFELLKAPEIDTSNTSNGTKITGVYTITSFDSGRWVIPPFSLADGSVTDSIPVDVGFTSPFDPNQEYHDIKDIIPVEPAKKQDNFLWYIIGGAVLLIALLVFLLTRKKQPAKPAPVVVTNAYEEAMKALKKLQAESPDAKTYHSQLADIFRLYVFRKKGILSLQQTTDDLVVQLKGTGLPKESFDRLAQALRLVDFIKFAKYSPAGEDNRLVYDTIKNSIDEIERTG